MSSKYSCPRCGSDNTTKMSLIYKHGHISGSANDRYGIGPINAKSDLAKEVAPPEFPSEPNLKDIEEKADGCSTGCGCGCLVLVLMGIIYFVIALFIKSPIIDKIFNYAVYLVILCSIVYVIYAKINVRKKYKQALKDYPWAVKAYARRLDKWEHSYICMRCGHEFTVDDD